jgi:hypothetical protein
MLPDQLVDGLLVIQKTELFQKVPECCLFTKANRRVNLAGIRCIEGNPEKNKLAIFILGHFGALQPAQCSMDAQS